MSRALGIAAAGVLGAWGLLAVALTPWAGVAVRAASAAALAAALAAIARTATGRRAAIAAAVLGAAAGLSLRLAPRASNDRAWTEDQSRLATSLVEGDRLLVRNVRAFSYGRDGAARAAWEDRGYDLAALRSVWFAVSPFSSVPGVGHVFVSFGFDGGDFLAISVEARREAGEAYSPLRGLFRSYETMYVVGREPDLMFLRSDIWRDRLYLYPVRATPAAARAMLLSMLRRANDLAARPEFYDTLTSSCSSNLARHVNVVAPGKVPASLRILFAGASDGLAFELGLIDVEGGIEEARARFLVPPGLADPADPAYSRLIRGSVRPPDGAPEPKPGPQGERASPGRPVEARDGG